MIQKSLLTTKLERVIPPEIVILFAFIWLVSIGLLKVISTKLLVIARAEITNHRLLYVTPKLKKDVHKYNVKRVVVLMMHR